MHFKVQTRQLDLGLYIDSIERIYSIKLRIQIHWHKLSLSLLVVFTGVGVHRSIVDLIGFGQSNWIWLRNVVGFVRFGHKSVDDFVEFGQQISSFFTGSLRSLPKIFILRRRSSSFSRSSQCLGLVSCRREIMCSCEFVWKIVFFVWACRVC